MLCAVCWQHLQTYVLKLAKSGADGDKVFLLLESGSRLHTVQVSHQAPRQQAVAAQATAAAGDATALLTAWLAIPQHCPSRWRFGVSGKMCNVKRWPSAPCVAHLLLDWLRSHF
jgi:hypothetical protein